MLEDELIDKEHLNIANKFPELSLTGGKVLEVISQQQQIRISTDVQKDIIRLVLCVEVSWDGNELDFIYGVEESDEHVVHDWHHEAWDWIWEPLVAWVFVQEVVFEQVVWDEMFLLLCEYIT